MKNPAKQETEKNAGCSLGWVDPLEEETATHSSILVWKIPWTEEPGRLLSKGSQRIKLWYIPFIPWYISLLAFGVRQIDSWGFPGGSDSKESACNVGDLSLILGLGRFPGEGKGYPLQYILAWSILQTEEPGKLLSMGLQTVGHDWVTFTFRPV